MFHDQGLFRLEVLGPIPHVIYEGVPYSSAHLKAHRSLLGQTLVVEVLDEEDLRTLGCRTAAGAVLPRLKVNGPWRDRAHDVTLRRQVLAELQRLPPGTLSNIPAGLALRAVLVAQAWASGEREG